MIYWIIFIVLFLKFKKFIDFLGINEMNDINYEWMLEDLVDRIVIVLIDKFKV